jgi:hypothetical protein
MQRRASQSRWVDHVWEPWGVLAGYEGGSAPLQLIDEPKLVQFVHPGFALLLHKDEIEGYYMNVSAQDPRVFVLWRMEERSGAELALPLDVTVSTDEAARWLDGGHSVDGVAMPPEIFAWVGGYVEANYRPEPKKRIKPRSFIHPKDRA